MRLLRTCLLAVIDCVKLLICRSRLHLNFHLNSIKERWSVDHLRVNFISFVHNLHIMRPSSIHIVQIDQHPACICDVSDIFKILRLKHSGQHRILLIRIEPTSIVNAAIHSFCMLPINSMICFLWDNLSSIWHKWWFQFCHSRMHRLLLRCVLMLAVRFFPWIEIRQSLCCH